MSRLYDTVEPAVINDELLQEAVEQLSYNPKAIDIAKEEGIDWDKVKELKLSFKNILVIDNLWCFTSLVKLQLDNNIIEKIEGLDALLHLVWLDLSFNNIDKIEGLNQLTKLEDLSLYNNRLEKLENLDSLQCLHVLSIGNNHISDLSNVRYLRRFKELKTLNLAGNPMCQSSEYKDYTVAHLPQLAYLDYRVIMPSMKETAAAKYEADLQQLYADEQLMEMERLKKEEEEATLQLHKDSFVEGMNSPQLFDSMFIGDEEGERLLPIPDFHQLTAQLRENFLAICKQIFETGLKSFEERKFEVEDFKASIVDAKKANSEKAGIKLACFNKYKDKVMSDLAECLDETTADLELSECHRKANELWDDLVNLEMELADQIDETVGTFCRNISEIASNFLESVRASVVQLRELESKYQEQTLELALLTLDQFNRNELDEDTVDELRELMIDRDTVVNTVSASHDHHLLKIDQWEDRMASAVNKWLTQLTDEVQKKEIVTRNRMRVTEINHIIDNIRDELDSFDFTLPA